MSFDAFDNDPLRGLIAHAGGAANLTVLLGAGASIEAGFPSWADLVQRLLVRAGTETGLLAATDDAGRRRWVHEAVSRDGYLGAAAIVEALTDPAGLKTWIPEELRGGRQPDEFFPGPICRQLPRLVDAFGASLELMTLNYDDLAEQALRDDINSRQALPYVGDNLNVGADVVQVVHLHGYAGRDGVKGELVLTEADYQRMLQGSSWQEKRVGTALGRGMVVFVGTSLVDPNLLRYLYGDTDKTPAPRYAIFVRQDTYEQDVPGGVREAREAAVTQRWKIVGVTAVFVDHYVDVAQLLYEMALAKEQGSNYQPLRQRVQKWVDVVEDKLLGLGDESAFVRAQHALNAQLRAVLAAAVAAAEAVEGNTWNETLAMTLWLSDAAGEHLINRATTDRVHVDRRTIDPIRIDEHARWVAVRSYCRGLTLAESRDTYASRWRFVRGLPLLIEGDEHGRIPAGCLTVSSMLPKDQTMLNRMTNDVEAEFNRTLTAGILELLDQPFRP